MDKQAYLRQIDAVIAAGRFKDMWESLCDYEIPKWSAAPDYIDDGRGTPVCFRIGIV